MLFQCLWCWGSSRMCRVAEPFAPKKEPLLCCQQEKEGEGNIFKKKQLCRRGPRFKTPTFYPHTQITHSAHSLAHFDCTYPLHSLHIHPRAKNRNGSPSWVSRYWVFSNIDLLSPSCSCSLSSPSVPEGMPPKNNDAFLAIACRTV